MSQFYEKHIFVCENVRDGENARVSCGKHNAKKIRVNMSGCLDRCELGPVLVSYPEGHWFTLKTESDVDIFVSKYILQNELSSLQNLQLI